MIKFNWTSRQIQWSSQTQSHSAKSCVPSSTSNSFRISYNPDQQIDQKYMYTTLTSVIELLVREQNSHHHRTVKWGRKSRGFGHSFVMCVRTVLFFVCKGVSLVHFAETLKLNGIVLLYYYIYHTTIFSRPRVLCIQEKVRAIKFAAKLKVNTMRRNHRRCRRLA